MSKPVTFKVLFGVTSSHWVNVMLHNTRRAMRAHMTRMGHKDSSNTQAACWQTNNLLKDDCVAELHFGRDVITVGDIAHEAVHAAYHRTKFLGLLDDSRFEEWVATDAGILTDVVLGCFDERGIEVKYKTVPRRSAVRRHVRK